MTWRTNIPLTTNYPHHRSNPLAKLNIAQGIQNVDEGMWVDSDGNVTLRTLDEADGVPFELPTSKLDAPDAVPSIRSSNPNRDKPGA